MGTEIFWSFLPGACRVGGRQGAVAAPHGTPGSDIRAEPAWAMRPGTGALGQVLPTGRPPAEAWGPLSCLPAPPPPGSTRPQLEVAKGPILELVGMEGARPRQCAHASLLPGPTRSSASRPPSPCRWALGTCAVEGGCCHPPAQLRRQRQRWLSWPHWSPRPVPEGLITGHAPGHVWRPCAPRGLCLLPAALSLFGPSRL